MSKGLMCDRCEKAGDCSFEEKFREANNLLHLGRTDSEVVKSVFGGEVPSCDFVCNCKLCRQMRELMEKKSGELAEELGVPREDVRVQARFIKSPFPGLLLDIVGLEVELSKRAHDALFEKRAKQQEEGDQPGEQEEGDRPGEQEESDRPGE